MDRHPSARPGQSPGDLQHPVVLGLVPLAAPLGVVEVLPPPGCVGADRLQVAVRALADPHLLPGGRDDQSCAPLPVLGREADPEVVQIDETLAGATPRPAGIGGGHGPQTHHGPVLPARVNAVNRGFGGRSCPLCRLGRMLGSRSRKERGGAVEDTDRQTPVTGWRSLCCGCGRRCRRTLHDSAPDYGPDAPQADREQWLRDLSRVRDLLEETRSIVAAGGWCGGGAWFTIRQADGTIRPATLSESFALRTPGAPVVGSCLVGIMIRLADDPDRVPSIRRCVASDRRAARGDARTRSGTTRSRPAGPTR